MQGIWKNRVFLIFTICLIIVVCELFLVALMPFFTDIAFTTANDTSLSNYAATAAVIKTSPWWILFIPPATGLIAIVGILKFKSEA